MSEPVRILQNMNSLHIGGSQTFIRSIYLNIDREKVQFDFVVTPESRAPLYDEIQRMGGRIFVCPKYTGKNHLAYCRWWNDFFSEHPEYHVVHGHVRSTAAIYLKIAKRHGATTIAHSHSTSNGSGVAAWVKDVMQLPIRHVADYLFACSDKAGKWLFGEKALKQSNYRMIPNGVDLERFAYDEEKRNQMRDRLGIRSDEFVIGHIGRFAEPKNHRFLVALFGAYQKLDPDSRLLMVGDGDLLDAVRSQCEELGVSKQVILPGSRMDVENFYQAMDVFVFPSLWEGLPVSVVEAQASGLQCLISDTITRNVNLTDLVKNLPPTDLEPWLSALETAKSGGRRAASDENMRRLRPFDSKAVARELQAFYLEQDEKARR